ncbi:MAG TPA: hypothetical protein VGO86_19105 [Candidatus Dormibacteraeota bacterium]|jgi:hypothetical protein
MERPQERREDDPGRRRLDEQDERARMGDDEPRRPAAGTATAEPGATPAEGRTTGEAPPPSGERFELFGVSDMEDYRRRWETLQARFVDDPRGSAEEADRLLGEMVEQVNRRHRELRDELGRHPEQGDTEAMRLALRRYRQFFAILAGT